jgi:purine-binding chemotaxis protein CheW
MSDPHLRAASIDWEALKARLARAGEVLRAGARPSPAATRETLDARARALAARTARPAPATLVDAVAFVLGAERYALEARFVREVIRPPRLARLPGAPAFAVGAANLRGEVVDVLDLRTFLGAASAGTGPAARLLVLGRERIELALVADEVIALVGVDPRALRQAPDAPARLRPEYLRGITTDGLALLDGAALLRDQRLVVDGAIPPPEVT